MRRTCLPALLMVACGCAVAGWEAVGTSEQGYLFVDRDSIRKEGDTVRMADLIDYKERQAQDGSTYQSVRVEVEYDCKGKRFRNLSATLHPYRMGEGDALKTYSQPEDWQPVPAGSGAALLAAIACNKTAAGTPQQQRGK